MTRRAQGWRLAGSPPGSLASWPRVRQHAAALAREPLEIFCDELLIGLAADDVAILAARPPAGSRSSGAWRPAR
ncbi:hypothetical protein [Streptomyces sp. NPDC021562]|uniref:hypothetical protein n=1 Tax=Streptomyces sp. NPDC021562 TaxID=3155121 RepID=UPI0010520FED